MARGRHRKLRVIGRWGVHLCALGFLFLFLISFIRTGTIRNRFDQGLEIPLDTKLFVYLEDGVLNVWVYPIPEPILPKVEIAPEDPFVDRLLDKPSGIDELFHMLIVSSEGEQWYGLPSFSISNTQSQWEWAIRLPLIYGVVLFGAGSVLLGVCARRSRCVNGCVSCGYSLEGLESDVCPECGEVYEA